MRTVSIGNRGGSAGKTTTAVTLAALAGQAGHRVLLVDADSQANATSWVGVTPDLNRTIGPVLLRQLDPSEAITETATPGVWLLPSCAGLAGQVKILHGEALPELRLDAALKKIRDGFDLVLIDSGSDQMLTLSSLVAADRVVTVTKPGRKEMAGVPEFRLLVEEVAAGFGRDLHLGAVVPCMVPPPNAGELYRESVAAMLTSSWAGLVTPTVRRTVRVDEAFAGSQPLPVMFPREAVTADYRSVADYLAQAGILPEL